MHVKPFHMPRTNMCSALLYESWSPGQDPHHYTLRGACSWALFIYTFLLHCMDSPCCGLSSFISGPAALNRVSAQGRHSWMSAGSEWLYTCTSSKASSLKRQRTRSSQLPSHELKPHNWMVAELEEGSSFLSSICTPQLRVLTAFS